MCDFEPHWLLRLQARAMQLPTRPRFPMYLGTQPIGTVESDYLNLAAADFGPEVLQRMWLADGERWRVLGNGTTSLNLIAQTLRAASRGTVSRHWGDEQLDVLGQDGAPIATVERGVIRPLGIGTRAVHLVGFSGNKWVWVQQRSLDKANDAGLWDTLMGGMIAAGETVESTLGRETWEEAGIRLGALVDLRRGGTVSRKDLAPAMMNPVNQDGEVARFELLEPADLRACLERDDFRTEAALILMHCPSR